MQKLSYILVLICLLVVACQREKVVYEQFSVFEQHDWIAGEKLQYKLPIEADKSYTLKAVVVSNDNYKPSSLSFVVACRFSNGYTLLRELPFKRATHQHSPSSDTLLLRPHLGLTEDCDLEVDLSIRSPYYNNRGIESLHFIVVEE